MQVIQVVEATTLPFRNFQSEGGFVLPVAWEGRWKRWLPWDPVLRAASAAQGLLFQRLISEWRGLPGTSEPFPVETIF